MSSSNTIVAGFNEEGSLVQIMPDGTTRPFEDKTDWDKLRALTEEEIIAAALTDPDNPPSSPERDARLRPRPRTITMRRALRLTQEEFAERYRIPLATIQDWEQERSEPDQTARAYLAVIRADPEGIARLLEGGPKRAAAE